jgi:hypothetical protein
LHLKTRLLMSVLRRASIYAKHKEDVVPQFVRIVDRVDQAQVPYPIAYGVPVLHTLDDARVLYSLRSQLEKVIVFNTGDSTHDSGAFQVDRILIPQLSANDVNSLRSQLLDDLW